MLRYACLSTNYLNQLQVVGKGLKEDIVLFTSSAVEGGMTTEKPYCYENTFSYIVNNNINSGFF